MELSNLFVNDLGLLCLDMVDYVVLDVGINVIERELFTAVGFSCNVFSIYEDPELMFNILKDKYCLFTSEYYVPGLYSPDYLIYLRSSFTNDNKF